MNRLSFFDRKLVLEERTNSLVDFLLQVVEVNVYKTLVAYLHDIQILLEGFDVFDLVYLRQVHLVLDQSVFRLEHIFLTHVVIDTFL